MYWLRSFRNDAWAMPGSVFDITLPARHKMLAQILNFFPQTHMLITLTSSVQMHFIFPSLPLAEGQAGNARELSKH
jgi:hypothetical protein